MSLTAIRNVLVIGAGPAGLTAAYELAREGVPVRVTEAAGQVGGISRTEVHKGYRFDIGGHRFFTQDPFIQELWEEVLGDELIRVPRLSRIYFGGRYYPYPLEILATLRNLGPWESLLILGSFFKARLRPFSVEETFDQWVVNRFGERLYQRFFRTYTEKVWGIPCRDIRAEWAAQRINGLSLASAVWGALIGAANHKTLIREFHYPRLGPGQLWERVAERIGTQGGRLDLGAEAVRIGHQGGHVTAVTLRRTDGSEEELAPERVVSSMPITQLIARLDPPPPPEVLAAAAGLKYRAFLIVNLVVRRTGIFPDQWLYIHDPGLRVGRIQNFGNWSPVLVADPATSCLGMEYFCDEGDALWRMEDADLRTLAEGEAARLSFLCPDEVEEAVVIRQPKAYPVYDGDYRRHLAVIRDYLAGFDNLQTIGRNGMHRYNNQDHSMLTAILAVRNLSGEHHDLWRVNEEAVYHEGAPCPGCGGPAAGASR